MLSTAKVISVKCQYGTLVEWCWQENSDALWILHGQMEGRHSDYSNRTAAQTVQQFWFHGQQWREVFLFPTASGLFFGSDQWTPLSISPGRKPPGYKSYNSPPSGVEAKNEWRYACFPPHAFIVWVRSRSLLTLTNLRAQRLILRCVEQNIGSLSKLSNICTTQFSPQMWKE